MDFLLSKFPPENTTTPNQKTSVIDDSAASSECDGPIHIKSEPEDVGTMPEVDDSIQVKNEPEIGVTLPAEHTATDENLQFDADFGATYGFTELNVSILPRKNVYYPTKLNSFVNFK